jgi:hypothetical protein
VSRTTTETSGVASSVTHVAAGDLLGSLALQRRDDGEESGDA